MAIRYLVFAFRDHYPGGGMEDCRLKTNDIEAVKLYVKNWLGEGVDHENLHVYDAERNELTYKAHFLSYYTREVLVEVDKL